MPKSQGLTQFKLRFCLAFAHYIEKGYKACFIVVTLKSPEHGLGINMGKNLNYPQKSK